MQPPGSPRATWKRHLNIASWGSAPHERNRREGDRPDPIPNSEVKPLLAESTAEQVRGRIGRSAHGRRFFCLRRGGRGPGGPGRGPPFFLRLGACAPPRRVLRYLRESLRTINRASCGYTASLLRCECKFVNFRKGHQFSSSTISFSIIEFLCFTMLFVRSFTFTCISTGTI